MGKPAKYRALSKNTILFTINSFGSKLLSFLLVPLYTYVLSTEEYARIDLVASSVSLLIPILTLNIQDAVLRFALDAEKDKKEVLSAALKLTAAGGVLLAAGLAVLRGMRILTLEPEYLLFLFLSYLLGAANNCLSMYLKARDQVRALVISGISHTAVTCLLNIVLLLALKLGVNGYLIASISGSAASILILLLCGRAGGDLKLKTGRTLSKEMVAYSFPLVFNSVAWWINNASDKYILALFCGLAASGIYSVAYKIPTILSTLQSVFYNAWSVSAIKEFDREDTDGFIGNVYTLYSCITTAGCSAVMLLNVPLAQILYAKDFFQAWQYVPFLLLGAAFNGLALFEGCLFAAVKRTKDVSYTTIVGAFVNTAANLILIPAIGALGAAAATMLGYFVGWAVRTIRLQKIVKMKVDWRKELLAYSMLACQTYLSIKRGNELFQIIPLAVIFCVQFKNVKKFGQHFIWFNRYSK